MACLELRKKNIKCIVYAGISRADGFRNFKTRPNENTQGQRSAWKAQISMATNWYYDGKNGSSLPANTDKEATA